MSLGSIYTESKVQRHSDVDTGGQWAGLPLLVSHIVEYDISCTLLVYYLVLATVAKTEGPTAVPVPPQYRLSWQTNLVDKDTKLTFSHRRHHSWLLH
jgi:hypothetical protein